MKKFEFGRFKIGNTETYRRINVRIIQGILISKSFYPNFVMILYGKSGFTLHRGPFKGIGISRLAKIPALYRDWLRSLN